MKDSKTLQTLARDAAACTYCFSSDRLKKWDHVPKRPADRPDDVAVAPYIGKDYASSDPRVVVMMLNPGHAAAEHKLIRKDVGKQLRDGAITYEEYNRRLSALIPKWGFGGIARWLRALELEQETIAFLNVALCAVAEDKYFPLLFETCFDRHTRLMLEALEPNVVLLCGKKQLAPYVDSIKALGTEVVLTFHYRPMHTTSGQAELRRVRERLDELSQSDR